MTELEELRLAYAECSRQKNELLTAHKHSAEHIRVLRALLSMVKAENEASGPVDLPDDLAARIDAALEATK